MENGPGVRITPSIRTESPNGKCVGFWGVLFLMWFGCLMGCSVCFGYVWRFFGVVCCFGVGVFLLVEVFVQDNSGFTFKCSNCSHL